MVRTWRLQLLKLGTSIGTYMIATWASFQVQVGSNNSNGLGM